MDLNAELKDAVWRKSSRSGSNNGDCVEVAQLSVGHRAVRDSKDPDGPKLIFGGSVWSSFVQGIKAGEFDV